MKTTLQSNKLDSYQQGNCWPASLAEVHCAQAKLNDADCQIMSLPPGDEQSLDYLSILTSIPAAVLALDSSGHVMYVNGKARELFGETVSNELWRDTIHRCITDTDSDGNLITRCDRTLNLEIAPLTNKRGQVLIFHDVTDKYEINKIRDHINRLAEIGEMAANLAHQIRTPLAASILFFSNIKSMLDKASQPLRNLDKGLAGLRHIESMISDMLMFSSTSSNAEEKIIFEDIFSKLYQEIKLIEQDYCCKIILSSEKCGQSCYGNSYAIQSALSNLIVNAAQACYQKKCNDISSSTSAQYIGIVHVSLLPVISADESYDIELRIEDNGIGINEKNISHVNTPFFTTKSNGTGLGLSVVKSIVESHRGLLKINSIENEGTIASIFLPRYK